jgi:hypothetical protein
MPVRRLRQRRCESRLHRLRLAPDRISDQTTREAITRLARALGTDLAWREPTGR